MEGRFNGGFTEVFCVTSLGGLYLEGLIHGGAYFPNFTVYICLVSAHDVMEHFAFPGNIDLAADDQRRILMCLFIVCETKFTIGESRTISHANDTQAQQVAPNPRPGRFSTETPLERERRLQIQREQRRRRRQQETAEHREHRLAQRRKRPQRETEEQRNWRLEYLRPEARGYVIYSNWATHEGNKSHNPSLQADNPYKHL